jgi:hypothetical protein
MLRADLTLKIRTINGSGQASEDTEYYRGNLMRRNFENGYQVVDFSTGRSFSVDLENKEYHPSDGAKMEQVVDPSHKVFVETTCSAAR